MNITVAKSIEVGLHILLADKRLAALRVLKAAPKEGDKKTIFGRPATFRSGKFVVDEPGAGAGGEGEVDPRREEGVGPLDEEETFESDLVGAQNDLKDVDQQLKGDLNPEEKEALLEFRQEIVDSIEELEGIGEKEPDVSDEEVDRITNEILKLSPEDQEFAEENLQSEDLVGLDAADIQDAIQALKEGEAETEGTADIRGIDFGPQQPIADSIVNLGPEMMDQLFRFYQKDTDEDVGDNIKEILANEDEEELIENIADLARGGSF